MNALFVASVGVEFGVAIAIGGLLGHWLDGKAHTDPWLTIVFLGLGFTAGIRALLRGARRAEKKLEEIDRDA